MAKKGRGKDLGGKRKYLSALAAGAVAGSSIAAANSQDIASGLGDRLQPAEPLNPTADLIKSVAATRHKMGFRNDEAYVRDLLTQPGKYGAVVGPLTGGHYATPDEVKELKTRLRVQEDALSFMRSARKDSDFAGLYIDRHGNLQIGFTKSAKEKVQGFRAMASYPDRVNAFRADHSMNELETLKDRIVDASPELAAAGIQISEVAVDIVNNNVSVGVVDLNADKRDVITSRFKGPINVVEKALAGLDLRSDTADPMRAGVRITMTGGGSCTSNWKAQDRDTGDLVMVTAGHCIAPAPGTPGGAFNEIFQGLNPDLSPRKVGIADQTTWLFTCAGGVCTGAAPVDAQRVPFLDAISSLPWLYAYDDANSGGFTNGEEAPVGGADGAVAVGAAVCSAGQFSPGNQVGGNFKNCGTVSQVNVARVFSRCSGCVDTFTLQNANVGDYIAIPGDSGAPVWRPAWDGSAWEAIAVGHHTGGPTGSEVFNNVDLVEDALNVDIVHF